MITFSFFVTAFATSSFFLVITFVWFHVINSTFSKNIHLMYRTVHLLLKQNRTVHMFLGQTVHVFSKQISTLHMLIKQTIQ